MRTSNTFQDWICLGRSIMPMSNVNILWVAGLNDLIAVLLGDFSHPLFPPWFGEQSIKTHSKWLVKNQFLSIEEKLVLLAESISTLILNASAIYNICFVWQPLHSRKKQLRGLTEEENLNIHIFFQLNTGKLPELYKSERLSLCYEKLISLVEKKVLSGKMGDL